MTYEVHADVTAVCMQSYMQWHPGREGVWAFDGMTGVHIQ